MEVDKDELMEFVKFAREAILNLMEDMKERKKERMVKANPVQKISESVTVKGIAETVSEKEKNITDSEGKEKKPLIPGKENEKSKNKWEKISRGSNGGPSIVKNSRLRTSERNEKAFKVRVVIFPLRDRRALFRWLETTWKRRRRKGRVKAAEESKWNLEQIVDRACRRRWSWRHTEKKIRGRCCKFRKKIKGRRDIGDQRRRRMHWLMKGKSWRRRCWKFREEMLAVHREIGRRCCQGMPSGMKRSSGGSGGGHGGDAGEGVTRCDGEGEENKNKIK